MQISTQGPFDLHFEETGSGDVLVFLPGVTLSFTEYDPLRAFLSNHFRVLSIDLPGSGKSGPQPRAYHADYYEEDAQRIAAFVRSRTDTAVHFVGHSDGGEVALLIAALGGGLARSVVSWGAAGAIDESLRPLVTFFDEVVDNPATDSARYHGYLMRTYGKENARATTKSLAAAIASIIDRGGDISRSKADQIRCPVLLLAGEHDVVAPKALVDEYAKYVAEVRTFEVKGGGHDLHLTHPDWLQSEMLNWASTH